jgi:hypothetical protein
MHSFLSDKIIAPTEKVQKKLHILSKLLGSQSEEALDI